MVYDAILKKVGARFMRTVLVTWNQCTAEMSCHHSTTESVRHHNPITNLTLTFLVGSRSSALSPPPKKKYIGYRHTRGKARSTYAPVVLTNYTIENSNGCPGNVMHKLIQW